MTACPCQSGLDYAHCCQPLHQGRPAPSPEALMRSRFSAFALGNTDYISRSWHLSQRPTSLTSWQRRILLSVLDSFRANTLISLR